MSILKAVEKERIIAMYYGQEGVLTGQHNDNTPCNVSTFFNLGNPSRQVFKLLLRPLSEITDEDAIGVARLHYGARHVDHVPERHAQYVCYVKDNIYDLMAGYGNGTAVWIYSYLVQKGYAVPLWYGICNPLNGQTAIEVGLAVDATTL